MGTKEIGYTVYTATFRDDYHSPDYIRQFLEEAAKLKVNMEPYTVRVGLPALPSQPATTPQPIVVNGNAAPVAQAGNGNRYAEAMPAPWNAAPEPWPHAPAPQLVSKGDGLHVYDTASKLRWLYNNKGGMALTWKTKVSTGNADGSVTEAWVGLDYRARLVKGQAAMVAAMSEPASPIVKALETVASGLADLKRGGKFKNLPA